MTNSQLRLSVWIACGLWYAQAVAFQVAAVAVGDLVFAGLWISWLRSTSGS